MTHGIHLKSILFTYDDDNNRSSESPQSTSLDTVPGAHGHHGHVGHQHTHSTVSSASAHASSTSYDSDLEIEPDPPDWQSSVSEDVLARLHPEEKKRQEIINGNPSESIFHYEILNFNKVVHLSFWFKSTTRKRCFLLQMTY